VIATYPDVAKKLEGMLTQWEKTAKINPRGFLD